MLRMGPEIAVKSRRIMTLRDVTPKGSLAESNNFSKGIQPNMAEYQEFFGGVGGIVIAGSLFSTCTVWDVQSTYSLRFLSYTNSLQIDRKW